MELYRPVSETEYQQIAASGFTGFPPRAPEQPIFHLILQQRFAEEIAQCWTLSNTTPSGTRYVMRFYVDDAYISQFFVQTVGSDEKQELWIPSEELSIFNQHILGEIQLVRQFRKTSEHETIHEKNLFFV